MLAAWLSRPRRLFYGWWIVAAGGAINALGGGVNIIGSSVLFLPLSRDLGLSRTSMSLVFSMSRAEGTLEGPLTGWLIDRFGPRVLIFWGAIIAGAGYLLLSQVHGLLLFLLVYLGLVSLGISAGFMPPILVAVNSWFVRHRGLAMSIVLSAFMGGGALFAPLLSYLVHSLGWRPAVAIVGLIILGMVAPLSFVMKRSPESMGLKPDGISGEAGNAPGQTATFGTGDFGVKEALGSWAFWQLGAATAFRVGALSSFIIHFVPILVWKGVSEPGAAWMLGAMAFMTVPLRIGLGWLADKWSKTKIMAMGVGIGVVAMVALLYVEPGWQLWMFIILFALLVGVSPLNWAIIGDFFGRRNFGTIRGIMGLFDGWATMGFPILVGLLYDRTLSYRVAVVIFALLLSLSALFFGLLRPPRRV